MPRTQLRHEQDRSTKKPCRIQQSKKRTNMEQTINQLRELPDLRHAPCMQLVGQHRLRLGRVHQFIGSARRTLALIVAGHGSGFVLWIRPAADRERLNPDGAFAFLAPERIVFVAVSRSKDIAWVAEEALRSGSCPIVVIEMPTAPGIVAVRRLNLAANSSSVTPVGLLLTGTDDAPRAESRWRLSSVHASDVTSWRLDRCKESGKPPASWLVTKNRSGFALTEWSECQTVASAQKAIPATPAAWSVDPAGMHGRKRSFNA